MNESRAGLNTIFGRFRLGEPLQLELARGGKIHETILVRTNQGWFVIQELKPPFNHLTAEGRLCRNGSPDQSGVSGSRALSDGSGGNRFIATPRACTALCGRMPGHVQETLTSPSMAFEAGNMAGRLHSILGNISYAPRFHLEGFHDPAFLLRKLIDTARNDPRKAEPVKDSIERFRREVPKYLPSAELPKRPVHGDLKVSNFLWDHDGRPCALLDFDTFMLGTYPAEIADAFRSWCGRKDGPEGARFDPNLFEAAWRGYTQAAPRWTQKERAVLLQGLASDPPRIGHPIPGGLFRGNVFFLGCLALFEQCGTQPPSDVSAVEFVR